MIHDITEAAQTDVSCVQRADSLQQIRLMFRSTSTRILICEKSRLTADLQRGLQLQEDGLAQEDLPGL